MSQQMYCTKHQYGALAQGSDAYKAHIAEYDDCVWEKYDPTKHSLDKLENNKDNAKLESESTKRNTVLKLDRNDPKILDSVARRYQTKIIGEIQNIKTAICCCISKDLPKDFRLSLIVLNQSSTGKSYFVNNILRPFRKSDDIVDFTDFTEAYFKRTQTNVNGKIIKIEQLEKRDDKGQLSFQRLKHLLSEGRLKFGNVEQNKKGERTPKEFEIVGTPVMITTATDSNIDIETRNRFLIMELDESEQQTEEITRYTLTKYASIEENKEWDESVKELEAFFADLKLAARFVEGITIPFAPKLESNLPKNIEIRRDLPKILNITAIVAFINHRNRDRLQNKDVQHFPTSTFADSEEIHKGIIIANLDDFYDALEIAGATIKQTINKTTQKTMELYNTIKNLANEKNLIDTGVTLKEIIKSTGWAETTVRDHLKQLKNKGFILDDDAIKEHRFYPLDKKFSDLTKTRIEFTDEEYLEWLNSTLNDSYVFVPSRDDKVSAKLEILCMENKDNAQNVERTAVSSQDEPFEG